MAEYKWNCSHCHNTHYGEDNLDGPRREGSVLTCTICREESEIVDYDVVYEYRTATKLPISVEFAREEGRHFIGIELNPAYVQIAEKRLQGVQQKLNVTTSTEVLEAEALRTPPNPKGSGIRAGDSL